MATLSGIGGTVLPRLLAALKDESSPLMSKRDKNIFSLVLQDVGLKRAGVRRSEKIYSDKLFLLAVLMGAVVLTLVHPQMPLFSTSIKLNWVFLFSLIIWQPFIEELLFRGVIQGQLSKYRWGKRAVFHITAANFLTSAAFIVVHLVNSALLWSFAIFIPSLIYGYFRDRFSSVYPSMILHGIYNSMVIVGLYLNGNAVI